MKPRLVAFVLSFAAVFGATSIVYCFTQQASLYYYPAHRLFEKRAYEKSIPLYEKCLKAKPRHLKALREIAFAYQWTGDYEKSIKTFRETLAIDPGNFRIKKGLAEMLAWKGQYDESIMYFQQVVDHSQDREDLKGLAQIYLWAHRWEKAQKILEDLCAKYPEDTTAHLLLARVLQYSGKPEQAVLLYEKVVKKQTKNVDALQGLAESQMGAGNYGAAVRGYQLVLSSQPENVKARKEMADILSWERDYEKAISEYQKILSKTPNDEAVLKKMADAYEWKKDFEKSGAIYEKLLNLHPENAELVRALAGNYMARKRLEEAQVLYRRVLLEHPEDKESREKIADILSWNKKYKEAIAIYGGLASEGEIRAAVQKARVLGWMRRYSEALRDYQAIYSKTHLKNVELEAAAKKAYWNGRLKKAQELYSEILEKEPENAEALFDLSQIFSYRAMWEEAIRTYKRLLSVFPDHFKGREGLKKAEELAFAPVIRSGYEFFESDSAGRQNDIRKHTEFLRLEMPFAPDLRAGLEERLTERSFSDFKNLIETESKINLKWMRSTDYSAGAFFNLLSESAGISPVYLFGANVGMRFWDAGHSVFSYERKRLENNSTVIRGRMFRDEFKERLEFDLSKRFVAGADYAVSRYSDVNVQHQTGADILYYISLDPRRLAVKYRTDWQGFLHSAPEYFAPGSLWRGAVTVDWKHYLGREEIFFGAKDFYYELEYEASLDSNGIAAHKLTGEAGYDFTRRFGIEFKVSCTNSSASVYKDKSASGSLRISF